MFVPKKKCIYNFFPSLLVFCDLVSDVSELMPLIIKRSYTCAAIPTNLSVNNQGKIMNIFGRFLI